MSDWGIFLATYLAATVEWVEAFTIVLAVSMSIGWGRAAGAAAAAVGNPDSQQALHVRNLERGAPGAADPARVRTDRLILKRGTADRAQQPGGVGGARRPSPGG